MFYLFFFLKLPGSFKCKTQQPFLHSAQLRLELRCATLIVLTPTSGSLFLMQDHNPGTSLKGLKFRARSYFRAARFWILMRPIARGCWESIELKNGSVGAAVAVAKSLCSLLCGQTWEAFLNTYLPASVFAAWHQADADGPSALGRFTYWWIQTGAC